MHDLKRWTEKRIIEAWHGTLTLGQISIRSGYSRSRISSLWAEAKATDRLPQTDRPHFPQAPKKIAPEPSIKRDIIDVRSVQPANGWSPVVSEMLTQVASLHEDERREIAEVFLAALIRTEGGKQKFLQADLSAMRVTALLRRDASGERPLPLIASYGDGERAALGTFADACIVHLHHGSNMGPNS